MKMEFMEGENPWLKNIEIGGYHNFEVSTGSILGTYVGRRFKIVMTTFTFTLCSMRFCDLLHSVRSKLNVHVLLAPRRAAVVRA